MDNDPLSRHLTVNFSPNPKRVSKFVIAVVVLLFLVLAGSAILNPAITYQWFVHDVRHPEVFTKRYEVQSLLFFLAFIGTLGLLWFNLSRAVKLSGSFLSSGMSRGVAAVAALLTAVREHAGGFVRIVSVLLAFFMAGGFGDNWNAYLLHAHGQPFGRKDPLFNMDLGFFVFSLPWYRALVNYALGAFVFTLVLTLGIYIGLQTLASLAKIELSRPQIRQHLSILGGITILLLSARIWLNCFEFGFVDNVQFTGAGFAASKTLAIQQIVALLVAALGLVTIVGGWIGQPFKLLFWGGVTTAALAVLGEGIVPAVIQRLGVEPNKIAVESPYAARAIEMTRFGYGLDHIEVKDFSVEDQPSPSAINESRSTLDNMRLWDPTILRDALEQMQALKPYYTFHDVDVDRYVIGGKQQMVMLSPRDIQLSGLDPSSASWLNQKLYYTHGYGVTMVPVNTATSMGDPDYLVRDMPVKSVPDVPISRPQIYFSKYGQGEPPEAYSLVHTNIDEFDYPSAEGDKYTRWDASHGIPIGGFWDRLMYSAAFGDGNLLVSRNITSSTKLLMHRDVLDRAKLLYPFLDFDPDPYIVVLDGKLLWVLDGYTSTDKIPYSEHSTGQGDPINYLRNPVKATIDAYTGEVNGYAIDPNEPILRCWRSVFPGLIKDASEIPPGLIQHFRYPEQLFMAQARMLTNYHVTQPTTFLTNGDAWDMPYNVGASSQKELLQAYYVQMKLPDEPKDGFMLILPFTPRRKDNMSGWLTGHCDPGEYGRLVLYRFTKGSLVPGPAQMETFFNQNEAISNINRQLRNEQSQIQVGNLLVIPIGKSVMYAEPLFLKSATPGIKAPPELKKVILAFKGKIVVDDTYQGALQKLFGNTAQVPQQPAKGQGSAPIAKPSEIANAKEALDLLDKADQALRSGDFGKYGELQKQLRAKLQAAAGK